MGRVRKNAGGSIRRLKSGRWQVRVHNPATGKHESRGTHPTKADAQSALRRFVSRVEDGVYIPAESGAIPVAEYIADWITGNARIKSPRTSERYEGVLRLHIAPTIGALELRKLTPTTVRRWHAELLRSTSPATASKAYRLLRAAMNTAVRDELITRNPCTVEGGGAERSPERPIATIQEINALADIIDDRHRLLVLMAAWTGLRLGELAALTLADVDLLHRKVHVTKNRQRLADGSSVVLPPKTEAGRRTVALPPPLVGEVEQHISAGFSGTGPSGLLFIGAQGAPLDRSHFNVKWRRARAEIGRPDLRFHDLRHSGNTLAAAAGATTRELMHRMGHASMAAAIRYQHASENRDQAIAEALGELMTGAPVIALRRSAEDQAG